MAIAVPRGTVSTAVGNHFSCSMSAVLLARVNAWGGAAAVAEVLKRAGSQRSVEYLSDIVNWISYDEAIALWRAGAEVTHHPQFARTVGLDAARRLNASPTATLLRSLGSPERVYAQIATTATKYSVASRLETADVGPGYAELVSRPADGFPRSKEHCAWTCGLLTQPPILFGLPAAHVEHEECAAFGAEVCRYRVTWQQQTEESAESERNAALRSQLEAMKERLHSMFATASDLIGADDIADVLARITDRAAVEVRAPSYLLAIRTEDDGPIICHHRGIDDEVALGYAETVLANDPGELPDSWLVVPIRSSRRDYGRLLALYEDERAFFAEERGMLEVYARYAASALDSATALEESNRRYGQSSALLSLARALADAGTSSEIARRLADAVTEVIDCDRVAVAVWNPARQALIHLATHRVDGGVEPPLDGTAWSPRPGNLIDRWLRSPGTDPILIDGENGDPEAVDPALHHALAQTGAVSSIILPLAAQGQFMGLLAVSVTSRSARLEPTQDLLDRLSGIAAQATTALQNGMLVDQITHQALHDDLTGLANRLHFREQLDQAVQRARELGRRVTVFYVDLDSFKPVNDGLGHDAGDALLTAVAKRLLSCTRADDVVARLGGDEFAVLIENADSPTAAERVSERLAEAFSEPFEIGGRSLWLGASIGRATFPDEAHCPGELLAAADTAMFARKRERKAL